MWTEITATMICGLISLTFVDSEVRTARISQVSVGWHKPGLYGSQVLRFGGQK